MASYGKIYEFVFDSVNGAEVVIVISKKNYTGSSSRRALGRPPVLKKENSGCIFGTSLEIYAECTVDGEYSQLYTSSADEFKVELYRMNQMVWFGFVSPELYSEPQIAPPYDVQIIATDGLGELKNFSFVGQGMVTIDQHLASILQHTGFYLAVDHVSSMTYGDGLKDAFTAYLDLDHLASETCYDVLQLILKTFHATITQYNGRWLIVRECDLATIGGSVSIADFGSKASSDFWPINFLSTVIDPAKKELTINTDAGSKGDILVNGSIDSDAGWDKSSGVEYNRNAKAYVLASQGDEISQRLNFGGTFLSGELTLSVIAQSVGEPEKKKEDGPTMRIQVVIQGKKGEDGEVKTWYLGQYASDETSVRRGMTRYKWSDTEEVIPMALPESSTFPDQDRGTEKYIPIPLSVDRENARTGQIIPGMYASEILVRIYKPYDDERDKYVYQCSLEGSSKGKLRYKAYLNNGARDTSEEIDVLLGPVTSSSSPVTDYAVPVDDSGAIIAKWGNGQIASTDFINYIVEDYARSVALPRQIITGILNVPTEQVPVLFRRDNTLYYIRQSSFDLYNDELDIQLVSIPYATVEVGAIEEMQSSGSSGGSGAGGDASSSSFAKLTVDLSMLDARIGDLEDMFFWADDEKTTIGTKYNFYSERQNAAGGVGDEEEGEGIGGGIIDEEMSDDSDNAVANRVIKAYIDALFNDFKDNPSAYIPLKTVNGMVLYGSGDIKIEGGSGEGTSGLTAINVNSQSFQPDNGIVTLPDYRPLEYYNQDLAKKVDKVDGKGLSTNDYTTADKNKLAGIAAGAEVNVQSDWNATSGDAFIRNKPTLAAVATSGSYADLEDKPVIPPVVTSDTVTSWGFTKNVGTVTGVKMNGVVKGSSGVVDLGTVITSHQDISGKVDKVDGKGLSTNDYTTADKNKLAGIAAGAEVNVQSDWNATSGDAFIRNKPTLAAVATSGSYADLEDKPVIPPVVTSDTVTSWGFIKTANLGALAFKNSLAFSELTSKPTTLNGYGIKDAVVDINSSDYPLPTDTQAFTSYCYANRGWKTTGPVISFPSGSFKGNIQIGMSSDNPRMFINCIYNGEEGVWTEVATALNISDFAVKVGNIAKDVDLDDYGDAGVYGFWGNITNSAGGSYGTLLVTRAINEYFTGQLFTDSQGHLFSRMREGTAAWRDWRTILDDNNYTSYVYSKTDSDAKYVPFAGHKTINGNVTFSGTVTSQGTFQTRYFDFFQDGVRTGGMAADSSNVETLYFITKNYDYRTIIHSGNVSKFSITWDADMKDPNTVYNHHVGYGYIGGGWHGSGPAISFGTNLYYAQIQAGNDTNTPYMFFRPTSNGVTGETWFRFLFDVGNSNIDSERFSCRGDIVLHRNTADGATFVNYGPYTNDSAALNLYGRVIDLITTDGVLIGGSKVLTESSGDGRYFPLTGNKTITGSVRIESGLTVTGTMYLKGGLFDVPAIYGPPVTYSEGDYKKWTLFYQTGNDTMYIQAGKNSGTSTDPYKGSIAFSGYGGKNATRVDFSADATYFNGSMSCGALTAKSTTINGTLAVNNHTDINSSMAVDAWLSVDGEIKGKAISNPTNAAVTNQWRIIRANNALYLQVGTDAGETNGTLHLTGYSGIAASHIRLHTAKTTITGEIDVTGATSLNSTLSVSGQASFNKGIEIASGQSIAFVDSNGDKHYITLDEENGAIKVIGNFFATGQNAAAGVGEVTGESGGGVANVEIKVNALSAYDGRTITTNAMQTLTGLTVDVAQSMLEGAYNKVIDNSGDYPEVWDYTARSTSTGIIIYLRIGDGYDMNTAYALTYTQSAANWSIIMGEI